jgi:hypothetical protein
MFSSDHVADLIEEFGLARGNCDPYGGGHARYPPCRDLQSKRIIRPNYSPFAKKLPNNSAYFSLDGYCHTYRACVRAVHDQPATILGVWRGHHGTAPLGAASFSPGVHLPQRRSPERFAFDGFCFVCVVPLLYPLTRWRSDEESFGQLFSWFCAHGLLAVMYSRMGVIIFLCVRRNPRKREARSTI